MESNSQAQDHKEKECFFHILMDLKGNLRLFFDFKGGQSLQLKRGA
jgi:hypothetical protein